MRRTGTFLPTVRLAMETVWSHKMRSFLTVLGVIIGTGTIIGVGSIIAGLDGAVTNVVKSIGANNAIIFKFPIGFQTSRRTPEELQRKPLTYEDARAIADRCPDVITASAYLFPIADFNSPNIHSIRYKGNDMYNINLGGAEPNYVGGGNAEMMIGRFFSEFENAHHMPVVVIGEDVPKALFPAGDALGKTVSVDGHELEVIGVMKRPAASFPGQDDTRVLIPYFTMRKIFPNARENMIVVIGKPGMLAAAIDEARAVLRIQRHVPFNKPDNFYISTAEQMIEQFHSITATVALVMVVMSSIGLLVGGIGVMNIMLVSVTERTREIGIRKAVGARRRDIVLQFLTEAVVLTGLGGLIGMTMGWAIAVVVRTALPSLPTAVPLWAAALGVIVSVAVGVFFGIWPANKAARLDPVVALRYE